MFSTTSRPAGGSPRCGAGDYRWRASQSAADYVALLATYSDHAQLPPARMAALSDRVRAVLEDAGGAATVEYRTEALFAVTPDGPRLGGAVTPVAP